MSEAPRQPVSDDGDTIVRNAGFALATQLSTAAFTAVLTVFLARKLGPHGYGLFALALAVGAVLVLPADLGISSSSARFVAERRRDRGAAAAVVADALRLKLLVAAAVCAALFGLAGPFADAYHQPGLAWPLRGIALAVFGQTLFAFYTGTFIAVGRIVLQLRVVLCESAIEFTASIVLVLLGAGAAGAAFGRGIGYMLGAAIAAVVTARLLGRGALPFGRRDTTAPSVRGSTREVARYAGVMLVVDSTFTLFEQLDVLLIGAYLTATSAGFFQAPLRLATFLHYGGVAGANAVAPRMARSATAEPNVAAFVGALRWLLLLQFALLAPVLLWAAPLVQLGLGGNYGESVAVLRALAPYIFLSGLAPLVSLSVNYLGEAPRRVPIALAAVAANLIVDVILIPRIGIVAGAIGSDVGFAIYVPAHLWICQRMLSLDLRPLAGVLLRGALAAGAMAGVLAAIGTGRSLSVLQWALGVVGAPLAFAVVLLATGELSVSALRRAPAALRAALAARR